MCYYMNSDKLFIDNDILTGAGTCTCIKLVYNFITNLDSYISLSVLPYMESLLTMNMCISEENIKRYLAS